MKNIVIRDCLLSNRIRVIFVCIGIPFILCIAGCSSKSKEGQSYITDEIDIVYENNYSEDDSRGVFDSKEDKMDDSPKIGSDKERNIESEENETGDSKYYGINSSQTIWCLYDPEIANYALFRAFIKCEIPASNGFKDKYWLEMYSSSISNKLFFKNLSFILYDFDKDDKKELGIVAQWENAICELMIIKENDEGLEYSMSDVDIINPFEERDVRFYDNGILYAEGKNEYEILDGVSIMGEYRELKELDGISYKFKCFYDEWYNEMDNSVVYTFDDCEHDETFEVVCPLNENGEILISDADKQEINKLKQMMKEKFDELVSEKYITPQQWIPTKENGATEMTIEEIIYR